MMILKSIWLSRSETIARVARSSCLTWFNYWLIRNYWENTKARRRRQFFRVFYTPRFENSKLKKQNTEYLFTSRLHLEFWIIWWFTHDVQYVFYVLYFVQIVQQMILAGRSFHSEILGSEGAECPVSRKSFGAKSVERPVWRIFLAPKALSVPIL